MNDAIKINQNLQIKTKRIMQTTNHSNKLENLYSKSQWVTDRWKYDKNTSIIRWIILI